jgi:hypothetical protein
MQGLNIGIKLIEIKVVPRFFALSMGEGPFLCANDPYIKAHIKINIFAQIIDILN